MDLVASRLLDFWIAVGLHLWQTTLLLVPLLLLGRALARALALGLVPAGTLSAGALARPSLLRRRLERIRDARRIAVMPKHRLAVACGLAVVALGSIYPIQPFAAEPGAFPELERLGSANVPVLLHCDDQPIADVLHGLSQAAGPFEVDVEGTDLRVTANYEKMPLKEALARLAAETGARFEVPGPRTLRVFLPLVIDAEMTPPERVSKVDPVYPADELAAGIGGRVVLQAVLGEDGSVGTLRILREVEGHPNLGRSAVDAVRRWRYRPALKAGRPVPVYFVVQIQFDPTSRDE